MKFLRPVLTASALVLLLSACGGDDNDDSATAPVVTTPPPAPPTAFGDVPATALANTTSFVDYLNAQTKSDTALPLNVTGVIPPTTETGLPKAL